MPLLGIFSIVWHITAYISWAYIYPQPYESLLLRSVHALLVLPLLFYPWLKRYLSTLFPAYYLFFTLFATSFFFFFMAMKNEWSTVWTISTFCTVPVLIMIGCDLFYIGLFIPSAYALSYLTVLFLDGDVRFTHFQGAYFPIVLFAVSGSLVANSWTHFRHRTRISLLQNLSGSIANEMKTPLHAIGIAIEAIKAMLPERRHEVENASITIPESALTGIRDLIDQEAETIRRSNKIIDSILKSLNGNAIDQQQFRRCSVAKAVSQVVETFGFESPEDRARVHLDLSKDFDYFGDRDLLVHCLFNLLNNALYYKNRPGFSIDISTQVDDQAQRIIIRDNGPGLTSDQLEKIFEPFYTVDKPEGNGLGLAFCRRVTESFGGTIACRSIPGKWTEFVLDLPKYESAKVDQLKKEQLSRKKVLIVDDQAANRIMLARYLSDMNCQYDQAVNGQVALEMAAKKRYDLILMDIEMPVLNGDEAVKKLRTGEGIEPSMALYYWDIPIIGITALPEAEAKRRTHESGMDAYALKPVDKTQLKRIIDSSFFQEEEEPFPGLMGAAILLVDDNLMTREFLKALLEPLGVRVYQAENGAIALELLQELPVDLVIVDLEMPVMGGLEIATALRNHTDEKLHHLPIISLGKQTDLDTAEKTKRSGIDIHLGKQARRGELFKAISVLLDHNRPQKTLREEGTSIPTNSPDDYEAFSVLDMSVIETLQQLGEPDLFEQLVGLFISDSSKLIDDLEGAMQRQDLEVTQRASHTLKGSSASMGAARLHAITTTMNHQLRAQGNLEELSWIDLLRNTLDITEKALKSLLQVNRQ